MPTHLHCTCTARSGHYFYSVIPGAMDLDPAFCDDCRKPIADCSSCGFGPGPRTGEVRRYFDRQEGAQILLCDDCYRFDLASSESRLIILPSS